MTKYSIILGFALLVIITSCQTIGQKAYTDLLKSGIILTENDTIIGKVGENFLYLYSFSAGVQPIYYVLKHQNSDSTILHYIEDQQFYVGDEDLSGGPSKGVYIFEAKKTGFARLEFYNPYTNDVEYKNTYPEYYSSSQATIEFYKTYTDSIALNDWTDAQYTNYYDNWSKLSDEAQSEAIDTLLARFALFSPSVNRITKTKIIKRLVKRYMFRESRMTDVVWDTLFNLPNVDAKEEWETTLKEQKKNLPLHENLKTTVCYVKIEM